MTELEENQDVPLIENIHSLDGMIKIDELSNKEFLLLAETLTRIGMICKRVGDDKPTLYQTAYVFHKKGNYYLAHYKQLYELDFKNPINGMTETDYKRLCRIARLLSKWGLINPLQPVPEFEGIHIAQIAHKDKENYTLRQPYKMKKRKGKSKK